MTAGVSVLEVPFNSSGTSDGVARMPRALRTAGLYDVLGRHRVVAATPVAFEPADPVRGPAGLLAERALVSMVGHLSAALAETRAADRWPLVIGGDCAVLLGVLRSAIASGVLFVDGHEDAWPPRRSPTGEAADSELGIALGLHPGPPELAPDGDLLDPAHVVVLGPRDRDELADGQIPSIARHVAFVPGEELAGSDIDAIVDRELTPLRRRTTRWWLHVDLDVLATAALPAVDYPQPGGLTWSQLHRLTAAALAHGGCAGASVVIYNPDLDDGDNAGRIVGYLDELVGGALRAS